MSRLQTVEVDTEISGGVGIELGGGPEEDPDSGGRVEQTVDGKQCPIWCSFREHQVQRAARRRPLH
jgi:hypothetical protein